MSDGLIFAFLAVVILIGGAVLFVVTNSRKGSASLDVERYRTSWMQIESQLVKTEPSSYQLVVLNADKLLDQALRQRGFGGETMGERMKAAQTSWSSANDVWSAHKLRNRIAHEPDISVTYDETRRALVSFKRALKDVGAI